MSDRETEGEYDKAKGKVRETVGKITDDKGETGPWQIGSGKGASEESYRQGRKRELGLSIPFLLFSFALTNRCHSLTLA